MDSTNFPSQINAFVRRLTPRQQILLVLSAVIVAVSSGAPIVGVPGTGGRGILAGSALELSNVDIAREFAQLILAQRGFQANSRAVTTFDEITQEAINLKR